MEPLPMIIRTRLNRMQRRRRNRKLRMVAYVFTLLLTALAMLSSLIGCGTSDYAARAYHMAANCTNCEWIKEGE